MCPIWGESWAVPLHQSLLRVSLKASEQQVPELLREASSFSYAAWGAPACEWCGCSLFPFLSLIRRKHSTLSEQRVHRHSREASLLCRLPSKWRLAGEKRAMGLGLMYWPQPSQGVQPTLEVNLGFAGLEKEPLNSFLKNNETRKEKSTCFIPPSATQIDGSLGDGM